MEQPNWSDEEDLAEKPVLRMGKVCHVDMYVLNGKIFCPERMCGALGSSETMMFGENKMLGTKKFRER